MTVQDIRTILRLTHEQGLSVREIGLRLTPSKTTLATYLLRAREAGLICWPLPAGRGDDATLARPRLFDAVLQAELDGTVVPVGPRKPIEHGPCKSPISAPTAR